jgi:NADH-quinone oxidoreductase subunit A
VPDSVPVKNEYTALLPGAPGFEGFSPWQPEIGDMAVYGLIILALMLVLLFLTRWLGDRKPTETKGVPYECGIIPSGSARFPYPAPFYLVAIFFLVFDVEAAFIFSWAIAFDRLGWLGWLQICFFIFILLSSLWYLWRKGGLEWGPSSRHR